MSCRSCCILGSSTHQLSSSHEGHPIRGNLAERVRSWNVYVLNDVFWVSCATLNLFCFWICVGHIFGWCWTPPLVAILWDLHRHGITSVTERSHIPQNKTNIQKLWEKLKKEKQGKLPSVTRLWATVPLMLHPKTWGKQEACSSPVIYSWPFFALKPSQGISGPLCCSILGHTFRSSFCSYQPELFIKALLTKALKTKKHSAELQRPEITTRYGKTSSEDFTAEEKASWAEMRWAEDIAVSLGLSVCPRSPSVRQLFVLQTFRITLTLLKTRINLRSIKLPHWIKTLQWKVGGAKHPSLPPKI